MAVLVAEDEKTGALVPIPADVMEVARSHGWNCSIVVEGKMFRRKWTVEDIPMPPQG